MLDSAAGAIGAKAIGFGKIDAEAIGVEAIDVEAIDIGAIVAGPAPGATPSTASDSAGGATAAAAVGVGRMPAAANMTNKKTVARPVRPIRIRCAAAALTLRRVAFMRPASTSKSDFWLKDSPSNSIDPRFALMRCRSLPVRCADPAANTRPTTVRNTSR